MAEPAVDEPARSPLPAPLDDGGQDEGGDVDPGSLVDQLKDLADDTRTAVEAEVAWQGVRAGFVAGRLSSIALWAAIALACVIVALLALAFGAILALTPLIGAFLATLSVSGALLLIALIAGLGARKRMRRLKAAAFAAMPSVRP